MSDCYYDTDGCLVCPERQAVPEKPAHLTSAVGVGWTAGANSVQELDGDFRATFTLDFTALGAMIGLRTGRAGAANTARLEHGVYVQMIGGLVSASVVERGRVVGEPRVVSAGTAIEIRRVRGKVTIQADQAIWHVSSTLSTGPKVVGGCLYASGDALPPGKVASTPAPAPSPAGDYGFALTSGTPVDADFGGHDNADFGDDAWWYIDVPAGVSTLLFSFIAPTDDPASIGMAVNLGSRPTGAPEDYESFDGFAYGSTNTLDFDNPAEGRWFVAADYLDVDPDGYEIVASLVYD